MGRRASGAAARETARSSLIADASSDLVARKAFYATVGGCIAFALAVFLFIL